MVIQLRKRHPSLMRRHFLTGAIAEGQTLADITWHGVDPDQQPDWQASQPQPLAYTLTAVASDESDLHIVMNMSDQDWTMRLPTLTGKRWAIAINTAKSSPQDIILPEKQKPVSNPQYQIPPRSVMVFESSV